MRLRTKCSARLIQHDDGSTEIVYYYTPQIFRFPFWMDILVKIRRLYNDGSEWVFREEWHSESTDRFQSLEQAEHIVKKYGEYLKSC